MVNILVVDVMFDMDESTAIGLSVIGTLAGLSVIRTSAGLSYTTRPWSWA